MSKRVIVAQPRVDGGAPLSAGVVPFRGPAGERLRWQIALVAKAAFSFAPGADGQLQDCASRIEPPSLCLDVRSALPGAAPDELAYPSDFVPRKGAVDVLVTGHAYTDQPALRLDAAITVAGVTRAILLTASGPALRLPLSSAYVRADDGKSPGDPVGPTGALDVRAEHAVDFDFAAYASAAPSQRLAALPPGATIELVGLSPRARRRVVALPPVVPAALLVTHGGEDVPVELVCDTLWIDTDAETAVLVYRGSVTLASPAVAASIARVDLWLERPDEPSDTASVRRQLQRGLFAFAAEEDDAAAGVAPPALTPDQLAAVKYALWRESPTPERSLEAYARISAELMEKREPRIDTLLRHDLDEDAWALEERAWMEQMGAAALAGDALPAKRYGDHLLAAQEALAGPEEAARTVDDYAPVKAAMDRGADPTKVLAAFAMTLPVWMRLDRRFNAAAAEDPALRDEIEAKARAVTVDPRLLEDELEAGDEDDDDEEDDEL